jgi:hypothetical protein
MKTELADEFLQMLEVEIQSRPSAPVFEMAYQARIAIDRIKFAIHHTEQFGGSSDQAKEANLQLLDALDRLQSAERHFQDSWRHPRQKAQPTNGAGISGSIRSEIPPGEKRVGKNA